MSKYIPPRNNINIIKCISGAIPPIDDSEYINRIYGAYPPIDIFQSDKTLHMIAEIPGVNPEDLLIYIYEGFLVLEGKKVSSKSSEYKLIRLERYFASFKRVFILPFNVGKCNIELIDGVLHIFMFEE